MPRSLRACRRSTGLRVIDMATVFAGPGAARHLADFGADVVKVESPGGRRRAPHGLVPARGRRLLHVEAARPEQARGRARPQDRRRAATRCSGSSTTPTCSIENFRPGTIERLGLGPDVLLARNPRPRRAARHRLRSGRPVRVAAGLRDDRRGDERLRGDQRRARRRAAAAADRAHRRGRRARGRVRGDGRAARARSQRRGSGGRREPARVDAPDDVGAAVGRRAPRLRAAAARFGHPLLGAARHVPLRRRRVDRDLDVGRVGRAPRARRCSASATTRASRRSRAAAEHRDELDAHRRGVGRRATDRPRCSPRSTRPRPRSRRCTRCASCWPIRTCARATCSSTVDGVVMQGPVARLSRTPGEVRFVGPRARRRHRPRRRDSAASCGLTPWSKGSAGFGGELDAVAAA